MTRTVVEAMIKLRQQWRGDANKHWQANLAAHGQPPMVPLPVNGKA
eukprot:SAG22_NODE_7832_length_703_cov_1.971854_1_plen_45_part_10